MKYMYKKPLTEIGHNNYNELKEYAISVLVDFLENGFYGNDIIKDEEIYELADFVCERLYYDYSMNNVMASISEDEIKEFSGRTYAYDEIDEDTEEGLNEEWRANRYLIYDKLCNDMMTYCKGNNIKIN